MEERVRIQDNYLWIRMPEELDHNVAEDIRREADRLILHETVEDVVFDFSKTRFMDSSGIGFIIGRYKKIQCFGGQAIVIHANRRILQMLYMAGLKGLIQVAEE